MRERPPQDDQIRLFSSNQIESEDFSPTRLSAARQRRGYTKRALAEKINVSSAAITQFENGTNQPSMQTITAMAFALNFPFKFFFGDDLDAIDPRKLTFRARREMSQRLRDSATAAASMAMQMIYPGFERQVNLPAVDIPDLSHIAHKPALAAQEIRARWGLGTEPIAHMIRLLEAKGVQCYWIDELARSVDAYCYWRDTRPFIFFNLREDDLEGDGSRARFDAAHELAHLVLHRHISQFRHESADVELQADQFASEFLMPESQFGREAPVLPVLSQFFILKERWGVSISAMVRRSHDIGKLSDWHYHLAFKEMSARQWRRQEICPIEREDSVLFPKVFTLLSEQRITPAIFAARIEYPIKDFLALVPAAQPFHQETPAAPFVVTEPQRNHLRIM